VLGSLTMPHSRDASYDIFRGLSAKPKLAEPHTFERLELAKDHY
jgi:hypothetical protein